MPCVDPLGCVYLRFLMPDDSGCNYGVFVPPCGKTHLEAITISGKTPSL